MIPQFKQFELHHWFFWDDSYSDLGENSWWAGAVRLGLAGLAGLLTTSFLLLIPRRKVWVTRFGTTTTYVYLLHTFVPHPIRESGILSKQLSAWPSVIGMIVIACVISLLLATEPVRRATGWLLEPRVDWLFRAREPTACTAGGAPRS